MLTVIGCKPKITIKKNAIRFYPSAGHLNIQHCDTIFEIITKTYYNSEIKDLNKETVFDTSHFDVKYNINGTDYFLKSNFPIRRFKTDTVCIIHQFNLDAGTAFLNCVFHSTDSIHVWEENQK